MVTADDKRAALLDRLTDHVLAHGLSASSLRPLARAAGTSDRMLLYYFDDKAAIVTAILARVAARLALELDAHRAPVPLSAAALRARMVPVLLEERLLPYKQVWLEVASLAARGDALYRAIGGQIGRGFVAWIAAQLDAPDEPTRMAEAAALLMFSEGILVVSSVGLDDVCDLALGVSAPAGRSSGTQA